MKTIPNSPILQAWLARKPELAELAKRESFSFEESLFEKTAHAIAAHHPQMNQASIEIRAALQLLFAGHPGEAQEPESESETEMVVDSLEIRLPKWVRPWAIAVFIVLCVIAFAAILKAEPEPANTVPQRQVLAAFHSNPGVLAQFGGIVIQLQNAGSTLATRGGGLVIFNCTGSGLSCSFSGSTFTLNGSGGGGTGCIPPGTTSDALLYDSGSGNCSDTTKWSTNGSTTITAAATAILDLSAAATFKVPTSAGCAPTVNAVACYDSTNHVWTFGSNGATVDLCNTQGGTAGQVFESNGGTSCGGYADPIVSGPDAPGAASTKNPVQVAGNDGTDVRAIATDASGDTKVVGVGTAGSASGGVITVQGVASMTKLLVTPDSVALPNHQSVNVDEIGGSALAIGQQLAAASIPVILPLATITTLTPPTPPTAAAIASAIVSNPPTVPVTKADGSDVTLGSKADAKNTATDTTAITIMQVLKEISAMEQAPASRAVTNAGTFAVQCTLANCANQTAGLPESTSTYAASIYEVDALTTSAAVKASAGNLYGWYVYNPNSSTCFLEVFNTASPTLGTTAPIVSLGIPATSAANIAPGSIAIANFSTAIEVAATTASKGGSTCGTGMTVNLWYQ